MSLGTPIPKIVTPLVHSFSTATDDRPSSSLVPLTIQLHSYTRLRSVFPFIRCTPCARCASHQVTWSPIMTWFPWFDSFLLFFFSSLESLTCAIPSGVNRWRLLMHTLLLLDSLCFSLFLFVSLCCFLFCFFLFLSLCCFLFLFVFLSFSLLLFVSLCFSCFS